MSRAPQLSGNKIPQARTPKGRQVSDQVCARADPTPRAESPGLRRCPVCSQHELVREPGRETLCAHPPPWHAGSAGSTSGPEAS